MRVYVVVSQAPDVTDIASQIATTFPATKHYALGRGCWLVAGSGTAKEVADVLRITPDGATGAGAVFPIDGFYGHSNPNLWQWLKLSLEQTG